MMTSANSKALYAFPFDISGDLLSLEDAACFLRMRPESLAQACEWGRIHSINQDGEILIHPDTVSRILASRALHRWRLEGN